MGDSLLPPNSMIWASQIFEFLEMLPPRNLDPRSLGSCKFKPTGNLTCTCLLSFCSLPARSQTPVTKVATFYSEHIPLSTDPKYHLPRRVIHQKNYNPFVIAGFEGFHDLLNYIQFKWGVKCHTNLESPCTNTRVTVRSRTIFCWQ